MMISWNLEENVPDMTGKTAIITGCTSGIGLESASQLLQRNANVVMACRNKAKMKAVAQYLRERHNVPSPPKSPILDAGNRLLELELDVSDLDSVRAFASSIETAGVKEIHALVLNAGVVRRDFGISPQGVELTFAANLLGHWLLTSLLLPLMQHVDSSRIVAVASISHYMQRSFDYELMTAGVDKQGDELSSIIKRFSGRSVYAQTKIAQYWFVHELNRRLEQANAKTIAVVAHPGYAETSMTSLSSETNENWLSTKILHFLGSPFRQTAEQGAWPLTMAATDIAISQEFHYGPDTIGVWGKPSRLSLTPAPLASNITEEVRLWETCDRLCQTIKSD